MEQITFYKMIIIINKLIHRNFSSTTADYVQFWIELFLFLLYAITPFRQGI